MTDLAAYRDLIARKAVAFEPRGLSKIPALHSKMFPHQEACTRFALVDVAAVTAITGEERAMA